MLRLWRATINTRNGLVFAIRSEQAVREELVALVIALPLAWLIGTTAMRRIELVAVMVLPCIGSHDQTTERPSRWTARIRPGK